MKAVGRTFSSVPAPTPISSSQKMPKSSSHRFFVFHYILVLYRWICSIFQSVSGHMKFTHLIVEQQDASLKHDEVKSSSNDLQDAAAEASLRHRIGVQNAVMPHDEERNSGSRKSLIANSSIPRTISLSSIPKNLNTSSLSTQIHKSASKQRNLSRLAELSETTTSPQPPVMLPSRQQATPSPKGERTSTPSIPHPLPLSYYRSKTLVLDLDETLIHSTSRGNGVPGASGRAHVIEVVVDKHACLYYVYKRPHVDYFLRKVETPSIALKVVHHAMQNLTFSISPSLRSANGIRWWSLRHQCPNMPIL